MPDCALNSVENRQTRNVNNSNFFIFVSFFISRENADRCEQNAIDCLLTRAATLPVKKTIIGNLIHIRIEALPAD